MPPKGEPRPERRRGRGRSRPGSTPGPAGPQGEPADRLALVVPKIASHAKVRPVTALDASRDGRWLAIARYARGRRSTRRRATGPIAARPPARSLGRLPRQGHGRPFHARRRPAGDGLGRRRPGRRGGDLERRGRLAGPADSRATATSSTTPSSPPTARRLATCGYDRTIQLWDADDRQARCGRSTGHNGAVYDVAFSPDGRFLVSASADDTCKVWRVEDGLRMDTLPQPLKEEYACAFSPDGRSIVAGGADNTIRVWEFVSRDKPRINPMVLARFAHEGPDRPAGVHPRRLAARHARRGPDHQGLGDRRLHRAPALGATSPTWRRRWPSRATAGRSASAGWTARSATYPAPGRSRAGPRTPRRRPGRGRRPVRDRGRPETRRGAGAQRRRRPRPTDLDVPARSPGPSPGGQPARPDADLYRFSARAGEHWVVEVDAARSGSKLDSFVEVLDAQGRRIERVRAPGGPRLLLHVPRQGRQHGRRLPPLQLGRDAAQRVPLCQRRGRQALALPPRAGLGLPGLSRRRGSAGATSTRPRWPTPWASPATSSSRIRPARRSSPTACRSSRSTTRTTTTPTASSARTRGSPSPRRPTASTW